MNNMNYLELIRMNMSYDELVPIYANVYDIMQSDVLPRGAVLLLQCVCVCVCVCELIQNIT